jgi:hypothetical protein
MTDTKPTWQESSVASAEIAAAVHRGELDKPTARARLEAAGYSKPDAWDITAHHFEPLDQLEALRTVDAKRVKITADCFFVVDGTIRKYDELASALNRALEDGLLDIPEPAGPDGLEPVTLTLVGKAALAAEVLR